MTTSLETSFLNKIKSGDDIPEGEKAYFRERLRNRLFNLIVGEFARQHAVDNLSKADIARRLARSPVQITRWLGAPGNWTIDTVSDLLLAISAAELEIGLRPLYETHLRNQAGPDWLTETLVQQATDDRSAVSASSVVNPEVAISSGQMTVEVTKPGFRFPQSNSTTSYTQVSS